MFLLKFSGFCRISIFGKFGLVLCFLSPAVFAEPVNINKAGAGLISLALQGIGPKKAAAIVAYREVHGDFNSLADLEKVKGIGPKILSANREDIMFDDSLNAIVKRADKAIKFDPGGQGR